MTGNLPRVDHIRVFGSSAWTYVPKEKRRKLEAKSGRGVLVSCFENSLYKVWIPDRQAAVLTRHVRILENEFVDTPEVQTKEAEDVLYPLDENVDKTLKNEGTSSVHNQNQTVFAPIPPDASRQSFPSSFPSSTESQTSILNAPAAKPAQDMLTYIPEQLSNIREVDDSIEPTRLAESNGNSHDVEPQDPSGDTRMTRYLTRNRSRPDFYSSGNAKLATVYQDPTSIEGAMSLPDASSWQEALQSEMNSLKDHDTRSIESLPSGTKPLRSKIIFKRKLLRDGTVGRYKARIVVKGYMQGNVELTYAPVVDFGTVRTLIAIAVKRNYTHQMDVRTAFLHRKIDEEVFIVPPPGCGIDLKPGTALHLHKGLYRLK